jgi:negative regulator of replication initiation
MSSKKFIGKTSRVNFDVPEVMHEDLHNLAETRGTSVSDMIRRLLAEFITQQKNNGDFFDIPGTQEELLDKFMDELILMTSRYKEHRDLVKKIESNNMMGVLEDRLYAMREIITNNIFEQAKKTLTVADFTNFVYLYSKSINREADAKELTTLMLSGNSFLEAAEKI